MKIQLLMLLLWAGCFSAQAQIRIIPQERLDSVANPVALKSGLTLQPASLWMGTIPEEGGAWSDHVTWRNESESRPVIITGVKSSCGCLQATYDARPLKMGEEGSIRVTYQPKGHPGAVEQRLFIYTSLSTTHPTFILPLRGHVTASADPRGRYPYPCGLLLLRQNEVILRPDEYEVRIACMNGGEAPITISEDSLLTPVGVAVTSDPKRLNPGASGDLIIRVTDQVKREGVMLIYLSGQEFPPRKRVIRLIHGQELLPH